MCFAETHACILEKRGGRNRGKDHTVVKLPEGEGRANPQLSTLLSLQTSEPFAPPPPTPHCFFCALAFHMKMLVFAPESMTGCPPVAEQLWFPGKRWKSNAPQWSGIQCVTPHFGSQAQTTESSIQQVSTWTCVYHIISGSYRGPFFYQAMRGPKISQYGAIQHTLKDVILSYTTEFFQMSAFNQQ